MAGVHSALCTIMARIVSGQYSECCAWSCAAMRAACAAAALVASNDTSGLPATSLPVVSNDSEPIERHSVCAELTARLPASITSSGLMGATPCRHDALVLLCGL